MTERQTLYPDYDVMTQTDFWDPHTRAIVEQRFGPFAAPKAFAPHQEAILRAVARQLVDDYREELIDYIIHQIDQQLQSFSGENQRQPGVPPARELIVWGLAALENCALKRHQQKFLQLSPEAQRALLADLQTGSADPIPEWHEVPQKDLFKKLVNTVIPAYYAHPAVWSEIGYGGPAYPRGYVRVELGLTDPWEAKK